jgi:hypothetical protein
MADSPVVGVCGATYLLEEEIAALGRGLRQLLVVVALVALGVPLAPAGLGAAHFGQDTRHGGPPEPSTCRLRLLLLLLLLGRRPQMVLLSGRGGHAAHAQQEQNQRGVRHGPRAQGCDARGEALW